MNPNGAEYGQAVREAFVLAQAIDDTSRDILMADHQPLGNYADATALYYTAYAYTLDSLHSRHPDEVQEVAPAYDARVFQLIQALEYAPPYMSPETDPDVRETALRAALSEALRQAIERVTQVQLQAHSEESIILAMRLAQRMADISNAIVDYGLIESDHELHRFIAISSDNVRDILHPEEEYDGESQWTMPQPDSMFTYVDLDDHRWAVGGSPRLAIDRPGENTYPEPPAIVVVEQGAGLDEVLPDTNWSVEQLEHLRSVINAVLKRVVIKEGDEVVYDGPYPQKPFELNPTLTRAIMEKLGFSLDILRIFQQQSPSDPRFVPLTFERQLKQWLDQVDAHYQNEDLDRVNFVAAIRTQAKSAVFNAISSASASHTKAQLKQARTKSIDRLILDLNGRVRALRESQ